MKLNSTTTYTLDFPMKDGKKIHTFKVPASNEVEAQEMLAEELLECCRQLQDEKKIRIEKAEKEKIK